MANYEENLIEFDAPKRFRDIKLLSFWSDKPSSWFALAESRFRVHGIVANWRSWTSWWELSARRALDESWTWWRCLLCSTHTHS